MSVKDIIETIKDMNDDSTVPKNVKVKLTQISEILQSDEEMSVKVNRAQQILEDAGSDVNMESYTRTQIWNLASMFEAL